MGVKMIRPAAERRLAQRSDPADRRVARAALALLCTLTAAIAAGCATNRVTDANTATDATPRSTAVARVPAEPVAQPAAVFGGATHFIPLRLDAPRSGAAEAVIPDAPVSVRLVSTGERLRTRTVALVSRPLATVEPASLRWLERRSRVVARPLDAVAAAEAIAWVALVSMPEVAVARGDALEVNGVRVPIRLLPRSAEPGFAVGGSGPSAGVTGPAAFDPPVPTAAERERLLERLRPAIANPTRWWRLALLWRLRPALFDGALADAVRLERRAHGAETLLLADAITDRWLAARALLMEADAGTADGLFDRLTAVSRLHTGEFVPAWPPGNASLNDLLRVLTLPEAGGDRRVDRARIYLRGRQPVALQVLDDAGRTFAPGRPRAGGGPLEPGFDPASSPYSYARPAPARAVRQITVAASEVRNRPALVSFGSAGLSGAGGVALRPLDSATTRLDIAANAEARTAAVEARVGRARVRRPSPARPLDAARPGLRLGPLAEPHGHVSWWTGRAALPPSGWLTAAMLFREGGRWVLYVEAYRRVVVDGGGGAAEDVLTVYTGQFGIGAPAVEVRAPAMGSQHEGTSGAGFGVRSIAEADVWRTWITLPDGADADRLLLGLTREDGRGVRTAWPRPLLPGQVEPGRRRIRLDVWGEVGAGFGGGDAAGAAGRLE